MSSEPGTQPAPEELQPPPFFSRLIYHGVITVFKNLRYLTMCADEQMEILASLLDERPQTGPFIPDAVVSPLKTCGGSSQP